MRRSSNNVTSNSSRSQQLQQHRRRRREERPEPSKNGPTSAVRRRIASETFSPSTSGVRRLVLTSQAAVQSTGVAGFKHHQLRRRRPFRFPRSSSFPANNRITHRHRFFSSGTRRFFSELEVAYRRQRGTSSSERWASLRRWSGYRNVALDVRRSPPMESVPSRPSLGFCSGSGWRRQPWPGAGGRR